MVFWAQSQYHPPRLIKKIAFQLFFLSVSLCSVSSDGSVKKSNLNAGVFVNLIHPEPGTSWSSQMRVTLSIEVKEVYHIDHASQLIDSMLTNLRVRMLTRFERIHFYLRHAFVVDLKSYVGLSLVQKQMLRYLQ